LISAIWLGCDLVAIDQLEMIDEWAGLQWSEIGHAPVTDAGTSPLNGLSLLRAYSRQIENPGVAFVSIGRAEGWVAVCAATHFAVMSVAARETGYPAKGQKRRVELWHDTIRIGALPSGATYKYTLNDANNNGQLINAFGLPTPVYGLVPPPISSNRRMMQVGLELPITIWGMFCCGRQLQRNDSDPVVMNAYRGHTALVGAYTNYASGDVSAFGPMKYAEVWSDAVPPGSPTPGQSAQRYGAGSGNAGFPNHVLIIEMAYRVQGSTAILATANHLGHHSAGYPNQTPAVRGVQLLQDGSYRGEWNLGLLQLLLTTPGPDVPVTAPTTHPAVTCTASPSPCPIGATVTFRATVTPGTNPASTGLAVTIDLSQTGEASPVKTMLDDGVSPDATAGDHVYTYAFDTSGVPAQRYLFPVRVTDAQGRRGAFDLSFAVVAGSTDPQLVKIQVLPNPVVAGEDLVLQALVIPGTSPDSTGIVVTANLSLLGGHDDDAMLDDGVAPDTDADDGVYTVGITVDLGSAIGDIPIPITLTDDQLRTVMGSATVVVLQAPAPATDPQLILAALSAPVTAGETATLVAIVTPGSEGGTDTITADVSSLDGPTDLAFEAVDVLTYQADHLVPLGTAPGFYSVTATLVEGDEQLTAQATLLLQIVAPFVPTDPQIHIQASPNPVNIGHSVTFTATIVPGTSPDSTGLVVTLDLSPFGGSAAFPLVDTGVAPDLADDDLIFTGQLFVSAFIVPDSYEITGTVTDAQERIAKQTFTLGILPLPPPPPVPDHTVPAMFDTLTHSTARITEGSTGKVLRYIRSVDNAPLLQANVDWIEVLFYDEGGIQPEVAISSSGRLVATAQNADGTYIVKTTVVVDGQSPSRAGHTFEYMVDANRIGLRGDRSYRMVVSFALIEPVIVTSLSIPLAVDEAYGG
jgi:hypothetical protein